MTVDHQPPKVVTEEAVNIYLERNRRLQRWAWISSAIPILVILCFIVAGTIQVKRLEKRKATLEERLKIISGQIDAYEASVPIRAISPQRSTHTVAGYPVTITINIAQSRPPDEVKKIADVFREHGYVVDATNTLGQGEWTKETTVRFFQYDRSTVGVGRELEALMRSVGFGVRTEFDDEFVGDSHGRPPGAFEVYIGNDASYNPVDRSP